ncbi:leucine-rich repeat receptor protein kinase EMS1 [Selaginella moellendorffii]|nr:leucine-rich repeat receptor protein kinase EMS1 [Selaginella moellendorffii]|eukprot:XP_002984543.2 leucine-rich repeat receptor protein kinase EMS1 [Selaginella moellendorffii]
MRLGSILVLLTVWRFALGQPAGGDDAQCLRGLKMGFQDVQRSLFSTWNDSTLQNPCFKQSFTSLTGVNCNDNKVVSIFLGGRMLGGTISPAITNCSNLNTLDLSDNQLTGVIPSQIGQLNILAKLNLANNRLGGAIPESLANCTYLSVLDLHKNALTGQIPVSLGSLQRLNSFDVSYNDLSGPIPYALANTSAGIRFNASAFAGNKHLYGYPLPEPKPRNLSILGIVGIGLGSGMLSLIVSFTAVCIWLRLSEQRLAAEEGKISQLMPE